MKQNNAIKNQQELKNLRSSCEIASRLMNFALREQKINMKENLLAENLEIQMRSTNAEAWAFPLIIGSALRATTLHAKPSKRVMRDGEMVLVDLGVRAGGMCSDLSRTFPVSGEFTKEMKILYQIVLRAQEKVIQRIQPGITLPALHDFCKEALLEGLRSEGVLKAGDLGALYPHKTSHWIGEKVHDPCDYFEKSGEPLKLAEGMCFTVEPGLYLKNGWGSLGPVGIRIEDVVLVTATSCEVITKVVKDPEEIEDFIGGRR